MTALRNSHRTHVAFYFETTPGAVPADAAAWAAAIGTTAERVLCEEADHAFIKGEVAVPNADMNTEVYEVQQPHKGLPNAFGGSIKMRAWGSGETYTDDTQVASNFLGRLLRHALGGGARGHHTTITAVTSPTEFTVDSATNLAVGYVIGIRDTDDPEGKIYPAQVVALTGSDVTISIDFSTGPFSPAMGDEIIGCDMAWPNADAITDPEDADYTTLSILYQKDTKVWVAGGSHLGLNELIFERGQQPKFQFSADGARAYVPGLDAPDAPSWTGTIQGVQKDTRAIGRLTKIFLQEFGTDTWVSETIFEAKFTPGVPVKPQESITEVDDSMPGVAGFLAEPADTILELLVALTDEQQERWDQGTEVTVQYYQVATIGRGYALVIRRGFLMDAPEYVGDGVNKWRVKIQATHDTTETSEASAAKFVFARF